MTRPPRRIIYLKLEACLLLVTQRLDGSRWSIDVHSVTYMIGKYTCLPVAPNLHWHFAFTQSQRARERCDRGHCWKEVEDALAVRGRLIDMLETAALPGASVEERRDMCAVVVVGGGPIGVSMAAGGAGATFQSTMIISDQLTDDSMH